MPRESRKGARSDTGYTNTLISRQRLWAGAFQVLEVWTVEVCPGGPCRATASHFDWIE